MSTQVAGIEISKPDKQLFPESDRGAAVTKLDLALYYESVAQVMLPHLRGRPVNMERFPDGIEKSSFYEKRVPAHFPDFVHTTEVATSEGRQRQVVLDDVRSLVYLAQQACVTPHTWLCRADALEHPDLLVVDLDPSVPGLARLPRGGAAPSDRVVRRRARAFARDAARVLVDREPDLHTIRSIGRRLARGGDRWADLPKGQSLGRARQKLRRLAR
jgi:bifunctional non-homologous end joining protein LigD